jgi:Fe-S-cluster containining protein
MPEKIITQLPLIRRYAHHNEAQDQRFRIFLKTTNISNVALDTLVQETTETVWQQIDCLKCANCCKTLEVVVDSNDIKRLSRRLRISQLVFQQKYIGLIENGVKYLKSQPCVFLGLDNRCSVYEDRPKACKDFPYLLNKGFRSRSLTMLAKLEVCPIVFNVWQQLKNKLWVTKA